VENTQRYFLGKENKLKSRNVIQQLFSQRKHVLVYPLKAVYIFENEKHPLQAGVSASKRNFKKAVDRNRIKRLIREVYRLQKPALENHLIQNKQSLSIFLMYVGKEMPEYIQLKESVEKIIKRMLKISEEVAFKDNNSK
jgi:ribonuclease P protein component